MTWGIKRESKWSVWRPNLSAQRFVRAAACALAVLLSCSQPLPASAATFSLLHSFNETDGANPWASLIQSNSTLYGTTANGGRYDRGTIFRIETDGSEFTLLRAFSGNWTGGGFPYTSLSQSGSTLYGTTRRDGLYNEGMAFRMETNGSGFALLHSFNGSNEGHAPSALIVDSGLTLYGTTPGDNLVNSQEGIVFKLATNGSAFTILHTFSGTDGRTPQASLIQSGSTLYGTTTYGGSFNAGTVFKVGSNGSGFAVLHSFNGSEGSQPYASLMQSGSTLYGTTTQGGDSDLGTVFSVGTDGSGFKLLHSFNGPDGSKPYAALTQSGSRLYGTSMWGGDLDRGTVFSVGTDGSGFKLLHSFNGSDGALTQASLIQSGSVLYGTTPVGGGFGKGTVFKIDLDDDASHEPAQVPRLTLPVASLPKKKNLIVYTHGCCTSGDQFTSGAWSDFHLSLTEAIERTPNPSEWTIYPFDWTALESGKPFWEARNRAMEVGRFLGSEIAEGNYDHVHSIAHSAGADLIAEAAQMIAERAKSDSTIHTTIHTTFLSPYARAFSFNNRYGSHTIGRPGDWSDNYIDYDSWPFTAPTFPNSHNVDVTSLNGSFSPHGWPLEFYRRTMPSPMNEAAYGKNYGDGYGFPRSLEGGGWETRNLYALGDTTVLFGRPSEVSIPFAERFDAPVDFSKTINFTSNAQTVLITGTFFTLRTQSPVWLSSAVTITQPVNELLFSADFVDNGAEGLLAVYWDSQYLGQVDQRYVLDGWQQYLFLLPQTYGPGTYSLAFRLDPYTDLQSSVSIDNVITGFVADVPEPSTLVLAILGLLSLSIIGSQHRRRCVGRVASEI